MSRVFVPPSDSPRMTMEDLAQQAGVSKITVSRALSGHPLVKETTRTRIRELAEANGYRINIAARNLRQQRTRTIAVVIEMTPSHDRSMSEPYPLSLLGGIMQELTSSAYNMVLTTMPLFVASPPSADGVILLGQGVREDAVDIVQRTGLPYVIWGSVDGNEDHITIGSDNVQGGRIAAEHLLFHGRKRFVFVGDATHLEIADRFRGFRERIEQNGCMLVTTVSSPFTQEGGYSAIEALLARDGETFDAVFAASDGIAMGVVAALLDAGRNVPEEISVIGFDDAPSAALSSPPITSIRQDWDRGGTLLAQKILALTSGGKPVSETMPVELKARGT
jgi:DNA-binding LacI/PurR family transcriptional regulator